MKHFSLIFLLIFVALPSLLYGVEEVAEKPPNLSLVGLAWTFFNSPIGITIVVVILGWVASLVFAHKPKWKKYADQYKPLIIRAVKYAERKIPVDSTGGLVKLDVALKYILEINSKLDQEALKEAVTAVHAEAERDNNLKPASGQGK